MFSSPIRKLPGWLTPALALALVIPGCSKPDYPNMQVVGPEGSYCTSLTSGRDIATGAVCVSVVQDKLSVAFSATNGWLLDDAKLWLGDNLAGVPLVAGAPSPADFPYLGRDLSSASSHVFDIPLRDLGGEEVLCQGDLHLMAHAAQQRVDVNVSEQGVSYADGVKFDPQGATDATYFSVSFSCPDQLQASMGPNIDEALLRDSDGDGVAAMDDCDDDNARVGALLFEEKFDGSATTLRAGPNLDDPWTLQNGVYGNESGGQQAQIAPPSEWQNTVTYARVSASALESKCTQCAYSAQQMAGGYALSLPGLYDGNTDHVATLSLELGARLRLDKDNGTASLEGKAVVTDLGGADVSATEGVVGDIWNLSMTFEYRGQGAAGQGPDGPNLAGGSQPAAITDTWEYYNLVSGSMVRADGSSLAFTQRGSYPLQFGQRANGENTGLGATVSVDFTAEWTDTEMVGQNSVSAGHGDIAIDLSPRDRFRAGILARAREDATQDEGFEGYRCGVARNSVIDGHQPGNFVQLSAFLDQATNHNSPGECDQETCPEGNRFDQLARVNHSSDTDILGGDAATLTFWAVGSDLTCEFVGVDGDRAVAHATDSVFGSGTTGLSTLNAISGFEYVKVCQAFNKDWWGDWGDDDDDEDDIEDEDEDGVAADVDCDDDDDRVGRVLFEEDFSSPTTMTNTSRLTDPWLTANDVVSPTQGGQQALLGPVSQWTNTVTFATLRADGMDTKCNDCAFAASAFAKSNGTQGHAMWMPGLYDGNTSHRVRMHFVEGARFRIDEVTDTAVLDAVAVVYDLGNADVSATGGFVGEAWLVTANFAYRGQGPAGEGPNGPKKELPQGQQNTDITDQWKYFDLVGGEMTRADGSTVSFTQRSSYPFQLGQTANGKNTNLGGSVWLDFSAQWSEAGTTSGHGDINLDMVVRDRFRAGVLARANFDNDQDEGYHGYRCAAARNSVIDCADPGQFVQMAAFLDAPEDNISSECDVENCPPNTTFVQLDRVERGEFTTDILNGGEAELIFWVVDEDMVCEYYDENGDFVESRATDDRFSAGTTGLSTLNAYADFEYIKVCEAFSVPEDWTPPGGGI